MRPSRAFLLAACALVFARPAKAGCTRDTDCKGERVCSPEGQCVDPLPCPPCPCEQAAPPAPAPPPKPPERPKVPDATTLIVTLIEEAPTTGIEVVCPSGFRERATFEGGVARVAGVPAEACALNFKGPLTARFQPVKGGQSLLCRLQGATAVCE